MAACDEPAVLVVPHPRIRHRCLADAHPVGDLGHRAVDEGVPRPAPTGVAARSAPLAGWLDDVVSRGAPRGPRRRQLRALRHRRCNTKPLKNLCFHLFSPRTNS